MLLSIGMIVKNEEKYLDQCLTALQPLLDAVDSELIIADTGSTDRTVEIAKKHTDKVYYFEWINDFAAARNFTMQKCQGEWFMFMDADEIIVSCDELIRFFTTDEHKKYGDGTIKLRSYVDEMKKEAYSDTIHLRLAKRFDDVAFINPIHEALSPIHEPIKMFNTIADHYGYFFRRNGEVTENARKKSSRNLEPLLRSLETNDNVEFSVYKEIADCYQLVDDMENALKYIDMGLEKLDHKNLAIVQYYSFKASDLMFMKKYDEVIKTCDEYFSEGNPAFYHTLASDFDMYAMRGEAYYRKGEYLSAFNNFVNFFNVYWKYKSGKLNTYDLLYNSIKVRDYSVKHLYSMIYDVCIKLGKYNTAADYMKKQPIEECFGDSDYMFTHLCFRIKVYDNTDYRGMKKFFLSLDAENRKRFVNFFKWQLPVSSSVDTALHELAGIKEYDERLPELIKIYKDYYLEHKADAETLNKAVEKFGADDNADILAIMLEKNFDISAFLTAGDFNSNITAHRLFDDFEPSTYQLEKYDISAVDKDALRNLTSLYGRALVESQKKSRSVIMFLEKYGETAARWKEEFPDEQNMPGDIKAGLIVHSITSAHAAGDYKLCISEMRRLVKACPEFAPFITDYQKMIKSEIMPERNVHAELLQMAKTVKQNIRNMLSDGKISEAQKTLSELEKICPNDPEIELIKDEIFKLDQN